MTEAERWQDIEAFCSRDGAITGENQSFHGITYVHPTFTSPISFI